MLSFFKRWKRQRHLNKLEKAIKEFEELRKELLTKAELLEEFANKRLKELELKSEQMAQKVEIFERIIEALDPKKRVN